MDRHAKWLRRRIVASVATQSAMTFAVVAVIAFVVLQWLTNAGLLTSLFASVVVGQLVAAIRIVHAMRRNKLDYATMRRYVDIPFTFRVARYSELERAHPVAERLPGFEPTATIRDSAADPEPVFDIFHDPSRLVAASVNRSTGGVSLVSSLENGRILVTNTSLMPPHERLVMSVSSKKSVDSIIDTHRRAISARSDVTKLASSAHQVVLDSLEIEHESYVTIGAFLSPFLDLDPKHTSKARLTAKIDPEDFIRLPTRLGPDFAMGDRSSAPIRKTEARPTTKDAPSTSPATSPVTRVERSVPQVVAPQVEPVAEVPQVVAPQVEPVAEVPEVVAPKVEAIESVPEVVAPKVEAVESVPEVVAPVLEPVAEPAAPVLEPVAEPAAPVLEPVAEPVAPAAVVEPVEPVAEAGAPVAVVEPVAEAAAPVASADPVESVAEAVAPVQDADAMVGSAPSAQAPLDLSAAIASLGNAPSIDTPAEQAVGDALLPDRTPALAQRPLSVPVRVPSSVAAYLLAPPNVVAASLAAYVANERRSGNPEQPVASQPAPAQPAAAQPAPAQPVVTQPAAAQPIATPPVAQPAPSQPVVAQTASAQPAATPPVAQPAPAQPAAAQPAAAQPAAAQPVVTRPVAEPLPDYILQAPPESFADAIVSAPDTAEALDSATSAGWSAPVIGDSDEVMLVPDLGTALGTNEERPQNRPRLSEVIRANNTPPPSTETGRRSRRRSR